MLRYVFVYHVTFCCAILHRWWAHSTLHPTPVQLHGGVTLHTPLLTPTLRIHFRLDLHVVVDFARLHVTIYVHVRLTHTPPRTRIFTPRCSFGPGPVYVYSAPFPVITYVYIYLTVLRDLRFHTFSRSRFTDFTVTYTILRIFALLNVRLRKNDAFTIPPRCSVRY